MKMKKTAFVFLALVLCLSGCANEKNNNNTPDSEQGNTIDPGYMCNLLWERSDTETDSITIKEDLDSDGAEEEIRIRVADGALEVSSEGYAYSTGNAWINVLSKVYALDMDTSDGKTELAVITVEDSDDPCMRIFRVSDGSIGPLGFKGEGGGIGDCKFTGYDRAIYVNEKNVLTASRRGMMGMWSVEASYRLEDGVFVGIAESERKVVYPSYGEMCNILSEEELIDSEYVSNHEEYLLLKEKGMAVAHADFDPAAGKEMMPLKTNDVFCVVSETDDGLVKIKKEDGEEGFIDLSDWNNNRMDVSFIMFFLAD